MNTVSRIILLFYLLFLSGISIAQNIIPLPKVLTTNGEVFTLNKNTIIVYEKGLASQANLLEELLAPATGYDFELVEGKHQRKNAFHLRLDSGLDKEEYHLEANKDQVVVRGGSAAGVFYAFQTIRQLMPVQNYSKHWVRDAEWQISGVVIQDRPEYQWRGMMLDVSRYFYDKDYVMRFIDMMSMHKMNSLHLHLTDDAGWRLEIKQYPKLTSVGAWRGEGVERTGGYYTQEDIKEIVAYAEERNVNIVPEIEVPAHALAAIASYPFLSCNEQPMKVQEQHSISRELFCAGKESTFEFLEDVLVEAFNIFPSKYFHIGGDEARYDRWKTCEHCQNRKKELGLKDEKQLQTYFNQRIQKIATKHGRTIVGWDEIIEEGLEDKAVGMVWHNKEKAAKATAMGHEIVLTLTDYCYFDFPESSLPGEVKAATWMPPISLQKVYSLDPVIEGLDEKYRPHILGGQGALWSDQFIQGTMLQEIAPINENRSEAYFDYLAFPRMAALAEVFWTPRGQQSWEGFEQRMKTHYNRLDAAGYGYRVPQPKLLAKSEVDGGFKIELENVVEGAEIRYTIDGVKPNVYSDLYTHSITIGRLQDFQAITVVSRKHYSIPLIFPVEYPQFEKYGKLLAEWRAVDIVADQQIELKRKATGKIDKNGSYKVAFIHTDGNDDLEIEGIYVYKNGLVFTDNVKKIRLGKQQEIGSYSFNIDNYETGAEYTIVAKFLGIAGEDNNGVIFIQREN